MVIEQPVDVALTPEGSVEIGEPPSGPGAHFFPVFGGLVGVDVVEPERVPFASLVDVARAAWWLEAVYGGAVAAAAVDLAPPVDEDSPDLQDGAHAPRHVAAALSPGHLWTPLVRFGIGTWIQRWWPTSDGGPRVRLDETLMDLENGVLAWSLEFVLGGTSAAAALLEGHVAAVLDSLENRSPDNALLRPVLRAIMESVPVTDEQYEGLREHESRLDLVAAEVATLTDDALARLYNDAAAVDDPWRARGAQSDLAHGPLTSRGDRLGPKMFAVDIEQVPTRSVSWAPDAVSGSLRAVVGALEVTVELRAGDIPTEQPLFARVFLDDDVVPASVVELAPSSASYAGVARIQGRALPEDFSLDVFTPSLMASPDPVRSARLREAVEPIFEALVESARTTGFEHEPVQDLEPSAPWRALVAGSVRRG